MLLLRPVCRSYLSPTSFMSGLRPLCCCYVLYDGITSFMLLLRPVCRDYVLHVVATSFMSGLRPLCRSYLSPASFMSGLRPALDRQGAIRTTVRHFVATIGSRLQTAAKAQSAWRHVRSFQRTGRPGYLPHRRLRSRQGLERFSHLVGRAPESLA